MLIGNSGRIIEAELNDVEQPIMDGGPWWTHRYDNRHII